MDAGRHVRHMIDMFDLGGDLADHDAFGGFILAPRLGPRYSYYHPLPHQPLRVEVGVAGALATSSVFQLFDPGMKTRWSCGTECWPVELLVGSL